MTKRQINYKNIERRESKKERERARKEAGTFKFRKVGPSLNSRGEPFYIRERLETPWVKVERRSKRFPVWINPITHEKIESPDVPPSDHVHYRWVSNY